MSAAATAAGAPSSSAADAHMSDAESTSGRARAPTHITIVEVGHNSSPIESVDRQVSMAQYQTMLKDAGKTDCPLLAALGYPVILVSTTPGRKCIPQAQLVPIGNSKLQNREATVAASRLTTGLSIGCVMGNVYALRTDGKDLTSAEWQVLFDALMDLMDDYGEGPGYVNARLLARRKAEVRRTMRARGLLRATASGGSGLLCWGCGVEGDEDVHLLKCGRCKTARYCSKECQREHWNAGGHKQSCKPPQTPSEVEADKAQALLQTAVLKPEQVIMRNAPVPALPPPGERPPNFAELMTIMPPTDLAAMFFNKQEGNTERYCIMCKTRYRLQDPAPDNQCAREQRMSGICSYGCWCALNTTGTRYSAPEWYGQEAQELEEHGVMPFVGL